MLKIPFTKMQGAGNDFIVIDHVPGIDYQIFTKKVCDRHMGVGADGVLILDHSTTADHRMRIINADGSEAEMCGNGARCMAVYIAHKLALVSGTFTIETQAGKIHAQVQGDVASIQLSDPKEYRPDIELNIGGKKLIGHFINTGVPHAVVFVHGLCEIDVDGIGRAIRNHPVFAPKGTNVNFVERLPNASVALRTYERGVEAETLACGTGSVAAALIGHLRGSDNLCAQKAALIRVVTKSTEVLDVTFDLDIINSIPVVSHVWLKGSGKFICHGVYYHS